MDVLKYTMLLVCLTILMILPVVHLQEFDQEERARRARTALEYVERVRNSQCTGGTDEILPVEFDHTVWSRLADVAVRISNLMTRTLVLGNGTFLHVDDSFFFDVLISNLNTRDLMYGCGMCLEDYVYPKYRQNCPYAYKKHGKIYAHDIAAFYDYSSSEYYITLKSRDWSNATVATNVISYRLNVSQSGEEVAVRRPLVQIEDGHWTYPYFDCGGGNIWLCTFTVPVFAFVDDTPVFRGVSGIDIDLTNIDINQCDTEEEAASSESVDVFRGTHYCLPSTKCVPVKGRGFQRGSYKCVCRNGFYFPDPTAALQAYEGSVMEAFFALRNESAGSEDLEQFECVPCAEGCDTCVDDSPCLYSYSPALRIALIILTIIIICLLISLFAIVALHKSSKPIKCASAPFLHVMNVGATLMCLPMLIIYPGANTGTCKGAIWPRHLGFIFLYGALLLKTWRISQIFRVKSARKLNLTDRVLGQRMVPMVAVTLIVLALRTAVDKPAVVWSETSNTGLKFTHCTTSIWEYAFITCEFLLLLWGAYLCYSVRKAPSHFNESKYITWAIYNNILLGSFILIIRNFIAIPLGPDAIYIVDFAYLQISVTATMCLIFVPKLVNLKTEMGDEEGSSDETVTGRRKTKSTKHTTTVAPLNTANAAVQTEWTFMTTGADENGCNKKT